MVYMSAGRGITRYTHNFGCVLWAITGTLDPVRNLTGLIYLNVYSNHIGGMFVLFAVGMMVAVVLEVVGLILRWRTLSLGRAVEMVERFVDALILGQRGQHGSNVCFIMTCS
jgi:hypothetical protein